ncbi:MAG: RNB domain-containing ribonuclease, partial [Pseudomonadota bacterium]
MFKGKIIKFFDRRKLISGMCLSEEASRIRVLCEDGKEMRLSPGRVLQASSGVYDVGMSPRDMLLEMRRRDDRQSELMKQVCPGAVWKQAGGTGRAFELTTLARTVFGETAESDHEAAVLCALMEDKSYFKLQGLRFFAYTPEQIERQQLKIEREHQRQELIRDGIAWLSSVLEGREADCEKKNVYVDFLKSFAAFGKDSPHYSQYHELFSAAGISEQKQCFDILVLLGIWDEDENVLLQRYHIPHQWPREVLDEVDLPGDHELRRALSDPRREDLTHLQAFSIDDSFTRDIDDAISFGFDKGAIRLGIHITDVSAFVSKGGPLDREAACRCTSLYLPEAKISMLPQALSENSGSLREGEKRPAVSFLITLSEAGDMLDCRGALSVVRVEERLSYGEVDGLIQKGTDFTHLYNLACALRAKRIAGGATGFLTPELQVRVDRSREVHVKIRDKESYSQVLVSECMILANYYASLLLQEKNYPALYRKQAASETMGPCTNPTLLQLFSRGKHFSRVVIDTQPGPHS